MTSVRTESIALTHPRHLPSYPAAPGFASDARDASALHPHFAVGAHGRTDMRTSEVAC